jgi:hypothetical protein
VNSEKAMTAMSEANEGSPQTPGSAWIDMPNANGAWWLFRQQCRGLFYGDDQVRLVFVDGPRMSFDRRTWYTTTRYLRKQPEALWLRIVKPSPPNAERLPPQRSGGRQDAFVGASEGGKA